MLRKIASKTNIKKYNAKIWKKKIIGQIIKFKINHTIKIPLEYMYFERTQLITLLEGYITPNIITSNFSIKIKTLQDNFHHALAVLKGKGTCLQFTDAPKGIIVNWNHYFYST